MSVMQGPRARAALIVGASALFVLIGAGCHTGDPVLHEFEEATQLLVLAPKSDGSVDVADMASFDAGSASSAAIDASPTGGANRIVGSLSGDRALKTAVFESAPLARTVWVDLDQPIGGVVYVGNSLSGAQSRDAGKVVTTFYVDGAFAGGTEWDHNAAGTDQAWNPVPIRFRAETNVLPKGSIVSVHISSASSLLDVKVGTGGAQQSMLQVPYYPFDPLAGAVFLEDGKLVASLSDDNTTDDEAFRMGQLFLQGETFDDLPPGHHAIRGREVESHSHDPTGVPDGLHPAILLPLPLIGMLGFVGRSPRRILAVTLVLGLLLAGCAGKPANITPESEPTQYQPSVNTTFEESTDDVEEQTTKQVGSISGLILDYVDIPVPGAHVSLLATNKFSTSDEAGAFTIADVPAGGYVMRVDAEGLESLEQEIEVQVAKITQLRINLAPPADSLPDEIAHLHNLWGTDTVRLLDEVTLSPDTHAYTQSADTGTAYCAAPTSAWGTGGTTTSSTTMCQEELPTDFSNVVIPGTTAVEVVLDWDDSGDNIGALGLAFTNTASQNIAHNRYVARAAGEPFTIQVFPNEADPGHQKFTNWRFYVYAPGADEYAPWTGAAMEYPEIDAKIYIHKGVVPFEPKHADRWDGRDTIRLTDEKEIGAFACTTNCVEEADGWYSYASTVWNVDKDAFVPIGTRTIEGEVWTYGYRTNGVEVPTHAHMEFAIGYKPANVPASQAQGNLKIASDVEATAKGFTFRIDPTDAQLDQWYQSASGWQFYLLAKSDAHEYAYASDFVLTADAVRDPSYEP